MKRRSSVKAAALAGLTGEVALRPAHADVPDHRWDGYDFGWRPTVPDRLNQGPFGAGGDRTIHYTTPSDQPIKNYGLGLVGYTWEENGPSLAARAGTETLEQSVEKLAALPFMDVLYIRCDWRDVQKTPGRLDLNPVWKAIAALARLALLFQDAIHGARRAKVLPFVRIPACDTGTRGSGGRACRSSSTALAPLAWVCAVSSPA